MGVRGSPGRDSGSRYSNDGNGSHYSDNGNGGWAVRMTDNTDNVLEGKTVDRIKFRVRSPVYA